MGVSNVKLSVRNRLLIYRKWITLPLNKNIKFYLSIFNYFFKKIKFSFIFFFKKIFKINCS